MKKPRSIAPQAAFLMLLSPVAANAAVTPLSTIDVVFYTASVILIAMFFLINMALKNLVGIYYAILFVLMLLLIWTLEGGIARLAPSFSSVYEPALYRSVGIAGIAFGFLTAERAIDPRRDVILLRRSLLGLAAFTVALLAPVWLRPFGGLGDMLNALLIIMFSSHFAATLTQRRSAEKRAWLPIAVALALPLAVIGVFFTYGADIGPDTLTRDHIFKLLFSLVALPTMLIISFALIDMRRSRETALKAALDASRRDSELSAALLEMEKNYAEARAIAAKRTRLLSTATHDIRQPIASLRAELDALKGEVAPESVERMNRILNHFDDLTDDLAKAGRGHEYPGGFEGQANEDVPARLLFRTIERMFGAEARAKGIDLRIVDSSRVIRAPAAALMRICGNLVANAIAHSNAKRLLLGVRRRGDCVQLMIIDDGAGFNGIDVDDAFADGAKSDQSSGTGLGLSIVRELSIAHDLPVAARSLAGIGSRFTIDAPCVSA